MNFNDLPEDCFRSIVDFFSLQQVIQLRAVCPQWRLWIERICAQKSSLKLFESFNVVYNYCNCLLEYNLQDHSDFVLKKVGHGDDDLLLAPRAPQEQALSVQTGHLLAELFPNLSKLVFYYYNWPAEMELYTFLDKWSHSLTSLALLGMPLLKHQQEEIWKKIKSLSNLNRLHLFEIPDEGPEELCVVLGRLEDFTLVNYDGDIVPLLSRLGPGIRRLVLDGINCSLDQFEELLRRAPHLPANTSHLTIGNLFCGEPSNYRARPILRGILRLICTHFGALQYFHPKFVHQLPLAEQIAELSSMEHLCELRLHIHSYQIQLDPYPYLLLSQLRAIHTLHLDYAFLDDNTLPDFVELVPLQFNKVHTVNVTVEYRERENLVQMEQYFEAMKKKVQYTIQVKDCQLERYMGRHRERYLAELENGV